MNTNMIFTKLNAQDSLLKVNREVTNFETSHCEWCKTCIEYCSDTINNYNSLPCIIQVSSSYASTLLLKSQIQDSKPWVKTMNLIIWYLTNFLPLVFCTFDHRNLMEWFHRHAKSITTHSLATRLNPTLLGGNWMKMGNRKLLVNDKYMETLTNV